MIWDGLFPACSGSSFLSAQRLLGRDPEQEHFRMTKKGIDMRVTRDDGFRLFEKHHIPSFWKSAYILR